MKKILILTLSLTLNGLMTAQTIQGIVTNSEGNPVGFITVKVKDKPIGTKTSSNGAYKLTLPGAGTFEIEFSHLNYLSQSKSVTVTEGENQTLNVSLNNDAQKVKTVKIKGTKSKESEQAILQEQKQAVVIQEKMGAEEMAKKGASDAAAAVTKMSGISREEGSSQIFVRGLGDRYNTTTLNGMFLPSDNPEFKNISLEYFPSEIIQSIGVSKTYNNTLLGDFGGASINIATKEFSGKPFLNAQLKLGFNSNAISNSSYTSGLGIFGTYDFKEYPTLREGEFIERNWQPTLNSAPRLNSDLSFNGGWIHKFNDKVEYSIFGTASQSNKYQYFKGIQKLLYTAGGDLESFEKTSYNYSINHSAMINNVLNINKQFKSRINYLLFRTASNQVNLYDGYNNGINDSIVRRRMIQDISNLHVVQWLNDYKANEKLSLYANFAANWIDNNQPNRLTTSLIKENGSYRFLANNSGDHSAYYQKIEDRDFTYNLGGKYLVLTDSAIGLNTLTVNLGYTFRYRDRRFEQLDYVFRPKPALNDDINLSTIDQAFSKENFYNGKFTTEDENPKNDIIDINRYLGYLNIHSPSIGFDFIPNEKITLNFGIRADIIDQDVRWRIVTTSPNSGKVQYDNFKILPFINAKYAINGQEQVKMAFSKTYTLPQFKELAPFLYFDISTFNTRGNPYLYASDNYNLDIKYENFIGKTSLFTLSGFGKFIQNPINKIFEAAAGLNQNVYANSGEQAIVLGVETEFRHTFFDNMSSTEGDSSDKNAFSMGTNIALLYSRQDLNKDKISRENAGYTSAVFTNTSAGIQGASPLVFNIDATYKRKFGNYEPTATLVMNYFSDRLYALGAQGAGDVYEKGVVSLDLITKHQFNKKYSFICNFRNILNPDIVRYQQVPLLGDKVVSSFKKGWDIMVGFQYNF
ncbi:MAG: carboxypeptidase-like regulatory domain-containing protein [Chitinophagales bacterium]|jgi:outer membrane receptor protein involved in Fe transport|nr:carboxypeptidase-like regulatory domain-containing protein [Chitinophagales bacterium]